MKKIIFIFLFLVFSITESTYSAWYGNHPVAFSNPGATNLPTVNGGGPNTGTSCNSDNNPVGETTSAVALNNASNTLTPHGGTPMNIATSGTMNCLYWDSQAPAAGFNLSGGTTNNNTWTNANVTSTITCSDTGGSGCNASSYQYRKQSTNFTCDASGSWNNGSSYAHNVAPGNTLVEYICFRAKDVSGNGYSYSSVATIKIDKTPPNGSTLSYFDGWTNDVTQEITFSPSDTDSGVANYTLEVSTSTNNPGFTMFGAWGNVPGCTGMISGTNCNVTLSNNTAYKYRLVVNDIVGNQFIATSTSIIKIDTTSPSSSDLQDGTSYPTNNSMHLATTGQTFTITPSVNGGSPIVRIQGFFEDSGNCFDGFHSIIDSNSSSISTIAATHNIKEVKPGCDFNALGYREYSFKITYLEDDAGNIYSENDFDGINTFKYRVFANTLEANIFEVLTENVTGSYDNVADGTSKYIKIFLKDIHDNPIIPATEIGREIHFNFNVNNNLYLNQSNNTGGSAVFMSIPSDSGNYSNNRISSGTGITTTFANQIVSNSSNGEYEFGYKVLAPTNHVILGNDYTINSISYDITRSTEITNGDNPVNQAIGGSNLQFAFKPIYTATFGGEIVSGSGFVEGTVQTGSIDLDYNGTITPSIDGLYFLQTGAKKDSFSGTGRIDTDTELNILKTNIGTKFISVFNISTNYIFRTLFTLIDMSGSYINDIKDVQLYSYIKYSLLGNDVTYLVGKLNETNTQSFETLKVYGITNINKSKQKDLSQDQDKKDVKNLAGQITKSTLRADIVKNALKTIKFVTPISGANQITDLTGSGWTSANNGKRLGNIIYYGNLAGSNVELNAGTNKYEGKKTIIVKGGNLYIKSNIINNSSNDILGIIVIPDELNRGGKVYIDTSVQEVDAVIFSHKSVISYNESYNNGNTDIVKRHEVDGNIDNQVMQNQLYIFGTVFSENTIGGSRKAIPVCPFWTKEEGIICTLAEAQKYDFNYLRAGKNNKYNVSYPDYPIIIKYNSTLQSAPPPLFSK